MSRLGPATLGLAIALGTAPASAAPGFWQRVREPQAAAQQTMLNRAERLLSSIGVPELDVELSAGVIALSQLSDVSWPCLVGARRRPPLDAPHSLDPRLAYLIGGALLDSQTNREVEARCLLERALREAPDSPLAADGLQNLARAARKLGDRQGERAAYFRALELVWDPDQRSVLFANLAECDMALGDLPRALREYRSALSSSQPELVSYAYFGLAVALDRSGDLPAALAAAKRAISIQLPPSAFPVPSALDLPMVSFTPSYEVHYYKALGAMAAAELVPGDVARRDALAEAVEQWTAYLGPAEQDRERWAPRAALHKRRTEQRLQEITAKLPKLLAPAPPVEPTL